MKVVILAGGLGSRLAEETEVKPKPMVEIGGQPILWHIMRHYAHYGFKEFYVALGYKGQMIKRYFLDYHQLSGDVNVDLATGAILPSPNSEPAVYISRWSITVQGPDSGEVEIICTWPEEADQKEVTL